MLSKRCPVAVHEVPVAGDEVPLAVQAVPVAGDEVPVAVQEVPVAGDEVPVAGDEVPVAGDEVPVAVQEVPVAVQEVPVAVMQCRAKVSLLARHSATRLARVDELAVPIYRERYCSISVSPAPSTSLHGRTGFNGSTLDTLVCGSSRCSARSLLPLPC